MIKATTPMSDLDKLLYKKQRELTHLQMMQSGTPLAKLERMLQLRFEMNLIYKTK